MINLEGQVAIITGGAQGIGEGVCKVFCDAGATVALWDVRDSGAETAAKLKDDGGEIFFQKVDITNREAVDAAVNEIIGTHSKIDILINNAGNAHGLATIQEGSIDDWDAMLDINVKGLLYVTKAILPTMIANNNGFIVNIGSTAGKDVYKNGNVYCASKFAVNALNKSMRLDLNDYNIRVSAIHPGLVETAFSEVRFKGDTARAKKVYTGYKALQADDIADIINFVVTRPYHVNTEDLVVYPTAQASATMINKN